MRCTRTALLLAPLAALLLARPAPAADPAAVAEDEQRLRAAKLGTDGPALLTFLRTRTRPAYDPDKAAGLIRAMGNDSDKVSTPAVRELVSLGAVAVPWLRRALSDPDNALAARRARACLDAIEGTDGAAVTVAAVRVLALRRPEGAARALLAFAPYAEDETVADEVRDALAALAVSDGQVDDALLEGLKDPEPVRRALAAEALCQGGAVRELDAVRYLLRDPKPTVRMRAAVALVGAKVEEAVPVLIDSLARTDEARARLAEEVLQRLAGVTAPAVPVGATEAERKRCRDTWETWWKSFDNQKLLKYFRERTLEDADAARFQALVKQLGNDSYQVRSKAMKALVTYRAAAIPILRRALNNADLEVAHRAEQCLAKIQAAPEAEGSSARARILAVRKPRGAAGVLLGYLPYADDEGVTEEVRNSLASLAYRDGRPNPTIVQALTDRHPARRAAAAEALVQAGAAARAHVDKLLGDPDRGVRLRVALALAGARHKDAVPVLIDSLDRVPEDDALKAEELLRRLADDKAPTVALGEDEASRKKARLAWEAWWKARGPALDMARLSSTPRLLGYTVIAQYDNNGTGEVYEVGKNGKVRWRVGGLNYAFDVQVLPRERVLIPEYNSSRVTERDFKGKVLWEVGVANPINAQRLPNGNTFIASRNQLMEVDKNKKNVFTISRPGYDIMAACKLRNGQIVMLSSAGTCLRLDAKGKELKSFSAGQVSYYGSLDVTPGNHILIAHYSMNKVAEYDLNGKELWHATVQWPTSVCRLPNGHAVVGSQDSSHVVELDRSGKKVWEYKTSGRPWRVRRR